jgi:hypothetical protein
LPRERPDKMVRLRFFKTGGAMLPREECAHFVSGWLMQHHY